MRGWDSQHPAKDVLVVSVRPQQHDSGGSDEQVEQVADQLCVREIVYVEGEFVSVRGGVAGVDDRDAGIGRQTAQWAHRASFQQTPGFLPGGAHVGKPGKITTDPVGGRPCRTGVVHHLAQCWTVPANQQHVGAFGRGAIGDRQRSGPSQCAGRPGDQHGAGRDRVHDSPFVIDLKHRVSTASGR